MSTSKHFGKFFAVKPIPGSDAHKIVIFDHPGGENFTAERGGDLDEAIVGLVDTLRVTRALFKEMMRQKGIQICAPNEFNREMVGIARKVGETPDDLHLVNKTILSELFEEMVAEQPKKKS